MQEEQEKQEEDMDFYEGLDGYFLHYVYLNAIVLVALNYKLSTNSKHQYAHNLHQD